MESTLSYRSPPCGSPPASVSTYSTHFCVQLFREEKRKQKIKAACKAAKDHRHNSIFTVMSVYGFSLVWNIFFAFAVSLRFWRFAKVLPTCLFSLLSIDVIAVVIVHGLQYI